MQQDLTTRFLKLSELLIRHQSLWRPIAFRDTRLPWRNDFPDLVDDLLALMPNQVETLCNHNDALSDFMAGTFEFVPALHDLCTLPELQQLTLPSVEPRFHAGIPGRKWQQVEQFACCLQKIERPVLEWCAGKSYLGFLLQRCSGQSVTALEWSGDLVQQANARAARLQVPLHSCQQDVLQMSVADQLHEDQLAVALHACGDLHEQLLRLGAQRRVQELAVAPCCYHKIAADVYHPLSRLAQSLALPLDKAELHMAVMETVTSGLSVRRQRQQLQSMRLGFDCLQRDVRGVDAFLPIPSLPMHWVKLDFAAFCRHCAQLKDISLPATVDWDHYLQLGRQRFQEVAALDLVRLLFRRPLEIWLALDRALFLQEQGYQVQMGTFCSDRITPRNILLLAQRDHEQSCEVIAQTNNP